MTRRPSEAGLNREITRSGWGLLVCRLADKAPGRMEEIEPAYTRVLSLVALSA